MLNVFTLERIFNSTLNIKELEDQILAALQKSRAFDENRKIRQPDGSAPTFRQLVFPPRGFAPVRRSERFLPHGTFLKFGFSGDQWLLQHALNSQAAANPRLATDGLLGPKTRGAVVSFQKRHHLVADGIVGPKTKGKPLPTKLD